MKSPMGPQWTGLALLILCAGCRQEPAPAPGHKEAEHAHAAGEVPEAEEGEHQVRIERGMLRDLRVTTRAAESRPAGDAVTVLGELRVNEEAYAEVGTSIPARVFQVLASPGDRVNAGQALAVLDSPEVGRARAALLSTKARQDLARQTAERRRGLAAEQIVPRRELEAAEAELSQSAAERQAAEDELSALGAQQGTGSRFVLSSPIAGTIIDRAALRGRLVDAEHPLFVVGDLRRLWLMVHAFERDALRVRVGAAALVSFPALPGKTVTGTVARVGSRVDPASRTIDVRIELPNPSGVLRPGMSASAVVPIGDAQELVVTVPVEALQRQAKGWCVFIPAAEEGVFEIRAVGRGRDLGSEVEIVSGLPAGERVVVDGAFLLKAEADKARGGGGDEHHH